MRRAAPLRPVLALAAAVAALACGGAPGGSDASPRNLILLSIDTLRADHLGCYGYDRPTSPTLDALAREGALFENVSSTASYTIPAHASMLTGLYPRTHGVIDYGRRLHPRLGTLPLWLRDRGFATGAFVNVELLSRARGFARGFEHYDVVPNSPWSGGDAPAIFRGALEWMRAQGERRFFAFVHVYDVHSSYNALPAYRSRFERPYEGPVNGTTLQLRRHRLGEVGPWGEAEARHLVDLYDAEIRQLDARLSDFLDALRELGLYDSTLLIVTSDHGEELLDRGGVLHGRTLRQEIVHVPLVLRGPGVPPGRRLHGTVSLVDLAPTALHMLGVPPPDGLEGADLSRAWREPTSWPPPRLVYAQADRWLGQAPGNRRTAVRAGRFKMTRERRGGRRALYDLEADPGELHDVSAHHPELADRLASELAVFRETGPEPEAPEEELSEDARALLRELGYLE